MPLTKREVSPVHVSRGTIPDGIRRDELQCCANGTLANLIRQLASISKGISSYHVFSFLGKHAENIFGEIYHDAMKLEHKTSTLQQRMERLSTRIAQLDTDTEQGSFLDFKISRLIYFYKKYKNLVNFEMRIVYYMYVYRINNCYIQAIEVTISRFILASLEELQMRKQFKSSCLIDQHTLDRSTLPNALERCYDRFFF